MAACAHVCACVCVCVCTCRFRVEGAWAGDAAQPSSAEWAPAVPGCPALLSPRGPRGGAGAPAGRPCSAETTVPREKTRPFPPLRFKDP